jgi:hypothetical protein
VRWAIFTNVLGADRYALFSYVQAGDLDEANDKAELMTKDLESPKYPLKFVTLPDHRRELWPDESGRLPK